MTALRDWVPDLAERDVYVCGPEEWTETVRRVTKAAGLPSEPAPYREVPVVT